MLEFTGIGVGIMVALWYGANGIVAPQEWGILYNHCIILSYYHSEGNNIERYSLVIHMYSLDTA